MIFQDLQLADGASALHNALGGCLGRHSGISTFFNFPKQEKEAANNWLEKFGLAGKSRQWASTLSRGERQRLAICRTLLSNPTLLLADEPVASLDSEWAGQTLQILKDSQIQKGGSLVCSLHDEDQVQRFADFVLRLHPSDPTSWSWETLSRRTES
jgi:phosphonate transport system ATP-binding protein